MKSKSIIDENGDKYWKLPNGKLHREDGPAVEHSDGFKAWYINGKLHRGDGPAIEYSSGTKIWNLPNGVCHRKDGPAVEYSNGDKEWYLNGKEYTQKEYKKKMRLIKLDKVL